MPGIGPVLLNEHFALNRFKRFCITTVFMFDKFAKTSFI